MSSAHFVLQVDKARWKSYKTAVTDKIMYMSRPSEKLRNLSEDENFW
jgi:hypothetical protein